MIKLYQNTKITNTIITKMTILVKRIVATTAYIFEKKIRNGLVEIVLKKSNNIYNIYLHKIIYIFLKDLYQCNQILKSATNKANKNSSNLQ